MLLIDGQLYHAILALSALIFAYQERAQPVYAHERYQKVLELLKNEDAASDGSFLTHFVLLLYEVIKSLLTM